MDPVLIIPTLMFYLAKVVIVLVKGVLILVMLRACHYGLEDDNHGSVNQRSMISQILVTVLTIGLTFMGILGVYLSHIGLFLTWLILKPVVKVLDLENALCSIIAVAIVVSGCATCIATYETMEELVTTNVLVM